MELRTSDLASVLGGRLEGPDTVVDGASHDSRSIATGQLFVPIVAERDGHDFIGTAVANGAAAYLTSGPVAGGTAVVVGDTLVALQAAGRYARSRLPDRVIGITGSGARPRSRTCWPPSSPSASPPPPANGRSTTSSVFPSPC